MGVDAGGWLRWSGYVLAFATVLPGVLLTAEVIEALGVFQDVEGRSFNLGAWQPVSLLVGVALLVFPLVWPHYTFPLIWGAVSSCWTPSVISWAGLLSSPALPRGNGGSI